MDNINSISSFGFQQFKMGFNAKYEELQNPILLTQLKSSPNHAKNWKLQLKSPAINF